MDPVGQKSIFGQKSKVYFFDKIGLKMVPRDLQWIFDRKIRNSNFRLKIDSGGQKIDSVIFQPKFAQKWSLEISNRFLVEK